MRTGIVIDGSLRRTDEDSTTRRNDLIDLIRGLAEEYHRTGLISHHRDPSDTTGWNVKGIETCQDVLCVDALAAIKDIEAVSSHFPID